MQNMTRHTGRIEIIRREPSSTNGNPRYLASVTDDAGTGWTFYTAPDSSLGYSLPNWQGKLATVTLGRYYGRLTLDHIEACL